MRKIYFLLILVAFRVSAYSQTTPISKVRSNDSFTQVDEYLSVIKRLGIPTSDGDSIDGTYSGQNSIKIFFNNLTKKLRKYDPVTQAYSDVVVTDLSNYYIKADVDDLIAVNISGTSLVDSRSVNFSNQNSVFLGINAGNNAIEASSAVFIGEQAGLSASSATNSVFLGAYAGLNADSAANSNFLGRFAGYNSTNASSSNFIGYLAGYRATRANRSSFIGYHAGAGALESSNSNFIGTVAGYNATNAKRSNFIGNYAGSDATTAHMSNFIGDFVGYNATNAHMSNFIGKDAGYQATNASYSNFIGTHAGDEAIDAAYSNFIGNKAGYPVGGSVGENNIIIGSNISLPAGTQNSLNIGGVIFGSGLYKAIQGSIETPVSVSSSPEGKIGIGVRPTKSTLEVAGDIDVVTSNKGLVLSAPDGTRWRLKIMNGGTLILNQIL